MSSTNVHLGIWTDWTKDYARSGTITLTPSSGNILIAFVALFIGAVSNSAWSLACYFLHQIRSSENPRNGLHHQIQTLLRNSQSPMSFAQQGALCSWAWRNHVNIGSCASLSFFSFLFATAFALVSIFSSNIANTEGNVLAKGHHCGIISPDYSGSESVSQSTAVIGEIRANLVQSQAYGYTCYSNSTLFKTSSTSCSVFVQRRLLWSSELLDSCPFGDGICNQSYTLDTGLINSALNLGINEPVQNQVAYRRLTTCSPLSTDGYVKTVMDSSGRSNITLNYGSVNGYKATLSVPIPEAQNQNQAFRLVTYLSQPAIAGSIFDPIPQLGQDDGLLSLFLLVNVASYENSDGSPTTTSDPWFNGTWYPPDSHGNGYALGALACSEKTQYCTVGGGSCTPLQNDALLQEDDFEKVGFNDFQRATAMRIQNAANLTTIGAAPLILAQNALGALSQLLGPGSKESLPLSPTQWITEVSHLYTISLAALQKQITKYVQGPDDRILYPLIKAPQTPAERQQCNNQIIYSQGYTSFSSLGIGIIFGIGGLTILLDTFLPGILSFFQRRGRLGSHRLHAWRSDNVLQLQRALYERLHFARWMRIEKEVPVTINDGKFVRPGAPFLTGSGLELAMPKLFDSDSESAPSERMSSNKLLRVL